MKLKKAILSVMDRDTLKSAVDDLELDGVDRRSREEMAATLSRARRAQPAVLLEYLYENQIKEVCELVGVSTTGRRNKLIKRLAQLDGKSQNAKRIKNANKTTSSVAKRKGQQKMNNDTVADDSTIESEPAPVRLPPPPSGMLRATKPELVWPGKYNDDGALKEVPRVSLPFQVIERINESRATREARKDRGPTLFDIWEQDTGDTFELGWRNKLIWGDNLLVMGSLLEQFAGKVDLIYIDPPFATGADFSFTTQIGESGTDIIKEQSIIEEKAYRDTWGRGVSSYLEMVYARLILMRDLLKKTGSIFVHVDWHVAASVRFLLDEVFGSDNYRNEIIWWYYNKLQGNVGRLAANHDVIFWYSVSDDFTFHKLVENRDEPKRQQKRVWDPETGSLKQARDEDGNLLYYDVTTKTVDDVWRLPYLMPADRKENVGFQTQKPVRLLRRILLSASNGGDLVADFFCGSGSLLVCAENPVFNYIEKTEKLITDDLDLGPRRWIGCDLSRWSIHTSRKRLTSIEGCNSFDVLNLGQYERQYWQGVTFGEGDERSLTERALYEYLAFILRLYGAQPVPGLTHLHGKKGRAMVHIGAVDAPVTIDEISQSLDECAKLNRPELHILGWEWEMGLYDLMVAEGKKKGVKLVLLHIPREVMEQQAVDRGDIQFFELAYLEVDIKQSKGRKAQVKLTDFVIPNTDLIPDEVRSKVKKWSDFIDYWSIDWEFQNDTFMQGWVAYRTRKERSLPLTSDTHTYEKAGKYTVLVKVIDIFGNDTSQAHVIEVK